MDSRRSLRGAQRAIGFMFFNLGFGWANWLARIPAVREQLQLNDQQLGLVLLSGGLGALVAFRLAPGLIRRWGTRRVGTTGAAAYGLLMVLPAVAPSGPWAALGLFLAGWFNGLMDVALNAQAMVIEAARKKPILAALHGCFSLGGLFGILGGAAAAHANLTPGLHLCAIGVALLVTSWLAGTALLQDAPVPQALVLPRRPPRALLLLGAIAFCSSVGEGAMAEWSALYLRDVLHASMAQAAAGFAPFSLAMIAGRLLGDGWAHAAPPRRTLHRCGLLAAAALSCGLLTGNANLFLVATLGVGLGLSLVVPIALRLAVGVPNVPASQALAIVTSLAYAGWMLCPPLVGLLSHHFGLRWAMGSVVLASLCLAWLATRLGTVAPRHNNAAA